MWLSNHAATFLVLGVICGWAAGCDQTRPSTPTSSPTTPTVSPNPSATGDHPNSTDPTNTAVNSRDQDNATKTPLDQNENQQDIKITAEIRQQVVDTKMSVNAQNVKIVTQEGKVTLRGPVATPEEKKQVGEMAEKVAGAGNVDNQLEVTAP